MNLRSLIDMAQNGRISIEEAVTRAYLKGKGRGGDNGARSENRS